jgi:hypothetical protein
MYFVKGARVQINYSGGHKIPATIVHDCVRQKGEDGEPMQFVRFDNRVTGWVVQDKIIGKPGDVVL